jgi:hypothetical protein
MLGAIILLASQEKLYYPSGGAVRRSTRFHVIGIYCAHFRFIHVDPSSAGCQPPDRSLGIGKIHK